MYNPPRFLATTSGKQSLVLCVLALAGTCAFDVCAQSASTGALTGTVTDPQGAVVPNATITLRNQGTGQTITTVTDPEGLYRFSLLPLGQYELTVVAVGITATTLCKPRSRRI